MSACALMAVLSGTNMLRFRGQRLLKLRKSYAVGLVSTEAVTI